MVHVDNKIGEYCWFYLIPALVPGSMPDPVAINVYLPVVHGVGCTTKDSFPIADIYILPVCCRTISLVVRLNTQEFYMWVLAISITRGGVQL